MAEEDGDRRTRHCKDDGRQTAESPAGASRLDWRAGGGALPLLLRFRWAVVV